MSTPVVHFSTLPDLLSDFGYAGATIRVATSQRTEIKSGQHFSRKILTVCVNVTALNNGVILSYMPFAKEIEVSVMTQHDTPSPTQKHDQAWKEATDIAENVRDAIRSVGHEPHPGRFDMGDIVPALGEAWRMK